MSDRKIKVEHRDEKYAEKHKSSIWREICNNDNPFIETDVQVSGFHLQDLVENVSYADMVFLMIRSELPTEMQRKLMNSTMVAFAHPGVRSEASRAAILAGVGKTNASNVLPVGLLVHGGRRKGAGRVDEIMKFLIKNRKKLPSFVLSEEPEIPCLSAYYGGSDVMASKICQWLCVDEDVTPSLYWLQSLSEALEVNQCDVGLNRAAVAAAAFCDLGFMPKYGVALLQLISGAGIMAQGFEHSNKDATVLPFVSDKNYHLKDIVR